MRNKGQTADFLADAIALSGLRHKEVAERAGFSKPNVISMMLSGDMKVPLERIPALARALNVEEGELLAVVLQEDFPEVWEIICNNFVGMLTREEDDILRTFRLANLANAIEVDQKLIGAVFSVFSLAARPTL